VELQQWGDPRASGKASIRTHLRLIALIELFDEMLGSNGGRYETNIYR
jgi:hypothetical protein